MTCAKIVERHNYEGIKDMVERAICIKHKLKRRNARKFTWQDFARDVVGKLVWYDLHGDVVERLTRSYEPIVERSIRHVAYRVVFKGTTVDTASPPIKEVNCTYFYSNNCNISDNIVQEENELEVDLSVIEVCHGDKEGTVNGIVKEEEVCKVKDKLDLQHEANSEDVQEVALIEYGDEALNKDASTTSIRENDCSPIEEIPTHFIEKVYDKPLYDKNQCELELWSENEVGENERKEKERRVKRRKRV